MKANDLLILGVAGVIAWFIVGRSAGAKVAGSVPVRESDFVEEIFNGVSAWGNGWRYFSDGTAIDPQGNYYLNGQLVYRAP